MIFVVNLRAFRATDHPDAEIVYVGRQMSNRPGSPLANTFRISQDTPGARLRCLTQYWQHLDAQPRTSPAWRELHRLAAIAREKDLALCCWCAPAACHADVVRWQIETINRSSAFWQAYAAAEEWEQLALMERVAILEFDGRLAPWLAEAQVSADIAGASDVRSEEISSLIASMSERGEAHR